MDIIHLPDDMTIEEKELLRDYKKNGCPGLVRITIEKATEWFNLYMGGKTYTEISKISHNKKDMILYIAEKSKWHDKRMSKYADISESIFDKTHNSLLESANTLTAMVAAYNRYYTTKLNKYLSTNDESIMESLDTKRLSEYRKTVESLDKLILQHRNSSGNKVPESVSSPSVNININGPAEVIEKEDSIDISQIKTGGDMLQTLLKLKKDKK